MSSINISFALFAIGVFLYYRPIAKTRSSNTQPQPGRETGHIDEKLKTGYQWFEDHNFFRRRY